MRTVFLSSRNDLPDVAVAPGLYNYSSNAYNPHLNHVVLNNTSDRAITLQKQQFIGWAEPLREEETLHALVTLNENYIDTPPLNNIAAAAPAAPNEYECNQSDIDKTRKIRRWLESASVKEQTQWVVDSFRLNENPVLNKDPVIKKEVIQLLLQYIDILAVTRTDYGHSTQCPLKIRLEAGARPFRAKIRPLNPRQLDSLKEQIHTWLSTRVIAPSQSEWGSALVAVTKKDLSTWWCIDFRPVNRVSKKDSYPFQSIAYNFSRLGGSQFFSLLDGCGAFHTLEVEKDSQDITTFVSPVGAYKFLRVPFGLQGSPSAYARFVDTVMQNSDTDNILAYLDDILVHSATTRDHVNHLRTALQLHRKAGIKINPSKTFLFARETVYLGHSISAEGISMLKEYLQVIQDWPTPQTASQTRSFLGKCGYYRSFIEDFADLAAPLDENRSENKFCWTAVHDEAFKRLKEAFLRAFERGPLGVPDFSETAAPFILDTDFSARGISYLLSQEQRGREILLACNGRKLNVHERNYSSPKGELLAIHTGCLRYESQLRFKKFVIRTDHRS